MRKSASRPSPGVPVGWMALELQLQLAVLPSSPSPGPRRAPCLICLQCACCACSYCWPWGHAPCLLRECCAASSPPPPLAPCRHPHMQVWLRHGPLWWPRPILSLRSCLCDRTPGHGLVVDAVPSMARHASKYVPYSSRRPRAASHAHSPGWCPGIALIHGARDGNYNYTHVHQGSGLRRGLGNTRKICRFF